MKLFDADLNVFSLWKILRSLLGRTVSEGNVDAGLKANLFGVGKNDETLFWEAVALAETKGLMQKPQGRQNINLVLQDLEYWQKKHFFQMIGKDTQSITIEVHRASTPEDPTLRGRRRTEEQKTKAGVEKTTMQGNLRGAMIIAFFAEMAPADAAAILKNSGTLSGLTDDIREVYNRVLEHLNQEKFAPLKRVFLRSLQELESIDHTGQQTYERDKQEYTKYSRRNWKGALCIFAVLLIVVLIWA